MPRKSSIKKGEKINSETEKKIISSKKHSQEDYEKMILELADKGMTSEKIGEYLRKQGIHPKEYNKKISKILKEKGKYVSPDFANLSKKLEGIKKHYEKNRQDKRAMREKDRIFSNIRKLEKYSK